MNKQQLKLLSLSILLTACSSQNVSTPKVETNQIEDSEKVISRIDSLTERPSWLKESEIFKIKDGNVVSLGSTSIPGNHRVDAAIRIAINNAKSGLCSAIEQRLDFIFQNAQEGTELDTNSTRFIGAEACKITTSSMMNDKIYWEKVLTTYESGEKKSQYKIFALVVISESEFKKAIIDSINKRSGKKGVSKEFAEKVDKHWDQFINNNEENSQNQEVKKEQAPVQVKTSDNSEVVTKHYKHQYKRKR